jgi:hypothetical protein
MNLELTPPQFRHTLAVNMSSGFDAGSRAMQLYAAKVKELVANFMANEKTT